MKKWLLAIPSVLIICGVQAGIRNPKPLTPDQIWQNDLDLDKFAVKQKSRIDMIFVNVKDQGAKGDNATDDTVAMQHAISVATSAFRGYVFIPAGNYRISSTLTLPDNVTLFGEGAKLTVLQFALASSTAIYLASSTDVKIHDLKLYNISSGNTSRAIYGQTIREFKMDNYEIEGFYDGLILDEPVNCFIGQGRWVGTSISSGTCITLGNLASGLSATADEIMQAYCSTYSTGVYVQAGNTNRIRSIFETLQKPIVTNTHAGTNARTFVDGAHFEANASGAILMTALGNSEIIATGVIGYDAGYVTDWAPVVSGQVSVITDDQLLLSTSTRIQLGTGVTTAPGNMAFQNEKGVQSLNPLGSSMLSVLRVDSSTHVTITANSLPVRVEQASVTVRAGIAGVGTALPATPVGYLYYQIAGVDVVIPYYTKP